MNKQNNIYCLKLLLSYQNGKFSSANAVRIPEGELLNSVKSEVDGFSYETVPQEIHPSLANSGILTSLEDHISRRYFLAKTLSSDKVYKIPPLCRRIDKLLLADLQEGETPYDFYTSLETHLNPSKTAPKNSFLDKLERFLFMPTPKKNPAIGREQQRIDYLVGRNRK